MNPRSASIETSRTILRRIALSDLESLHRFESNPLIMQFTPSRIPQTLEQTKTRLEGQIAKQASLEPFGIWMADLKATSTPVGWFMLMPAENSQLELGFMILQSHWNLGLTTEVSRALIEYVRKQTGIGKIIAKTNHDNFASQRALEKLGFQRTGTTTVPEKVLGGEIVLQNFELLM